MKSKMTNRIANSIQRFNETAMRTIRHQIIVTAVLVLFALSGQLNAQSEPDHFVPFQDFIAKTASANAAEFLARPESHVIDAAAFEQMRQHILTMYQGVEVRHSFLLHSEYVDCVPTEQQPSVRLLDLKGIAQPPPQPVEHEDGLSAGTTEAATQVGPDDRFDRLGNSTECEDNTIPMRRITLDELSRFATLQDFFSKIPDGTPEAPASHKYAYTYQTVNNLGGNSGLNLWKPHVETSKGEVFSLSQVWYSGGSGGSLQTAEGGWQNYPGKYGSQNSVLFIYWTADGYQRTGCYNLDCSAFVQTNKSWTLGGAFSNYSTYGGTQYDFTVVWELYQGNWWLALSGKAPKQWIGYYPGSIYRGGQLTRHAQTITYGGETVGSTVWPPMGSGDWANKGFRYAAYQRQVFYIDLTGTSQWANLTAQQLSPACYTVAGPYWDNNTTWGVYFYFGGPGGSRC